MTCLHTDNFNERDKEYFETRCSNGCLLQAGVVQEYQYWDAPDGYGVRPGDTQLKIRDNFDPSVNDGEGLFPECGYITLPGPDPECNDGSMTEYLQIEYIERNTNLGYTTVHFHKLSGINCDMTNYGGAQYYHRTNEVVIVGSPDNPYYDCDKCKDTNLLRQEVRCFVNQPYDLANVESPVHGERCIVKDSYSNGCNYTRTFVYDCDYNSGYSGIEHWRPTQRECIFDSYDALVSSIVNPYEGDKAVVINENDICQQCAYECIYHNGNWVKLLCQPQLEAVITSVDPKRFKLVGAAVGDDPAEEDWKDVGNDLGVINQHYDCRTKVIYTVNMDYGAQVNDGAPDGRQVSITKFRLRLNGETAYVWSQTQEIWVNSAAGAGTNEDQSMYTAPVDIPGPGDYRFSLQYAITYGNINCTAHINETETQIWHCVNSYI